MKTAEEWFSELTDGSNSDCALISIEEIKSIQHDARQSAFKEAAEVVLMNGVGIDRFPLSDGQMAYRYRGSQKQAILTHAEKEKSK